MLLIPPKFDQNNFTVLDAFWGLISIDDLDLRRFLNKTLWDFSRTNINMQLVLIAV